MQAAARQIKQHTRCHAAVPYTPSSFFISQNTICNSKQDTRERGSAHKRSSAQRKTPFNIQIKISLKSRAYFWFLHHVVVKHSSEKAEHLTAMYCRNWSINLKTFEVFFVFYILFFFQKNMCAL